MRERAISAARPRPGPAHRPRASAGRGPGGRRPLVTAVAARRGLPAAPWRPATRRSSARDGARARDRPRRGGPGGARGQRRSLARRGHPGRRSAPFTKARSTRRPPVVDGDGLRGVLHRAARRSSSGSATPAPTSRPRRRSTSLAPSAAGPDAAAHGLGLRYRRLPRRQRTLRPDEVHRPHLAGKDRRGRGRGVVAKHHRGRGVALGSWPEPVQPCFSGHSSRLPPRPATSPNRSSSGPRGQGFGDTHPGARRHARPRRLVHLRRTGHDPVCPHLPSLSVVGKGSDPHAASRSSARPVRSGVRP